MSVVTDEVNRAPASWRSAVPHTSLLIACYGVEQYLPDFLASLEAQSAWHAGYELIFVIDGSPDASESIVRAWMMTTDYHVRVIVQANGGVAAARNAALAQARGEWISAPDPDDVLAPDYLAEVERARVAFRAERMFVARIQVKAPDGRDLPHALDFKFAGPRPRVIDLAQEPEAIQTPGGNVFLKRAEITALGLRYDERLRQASDSMFLAHFLLRAGARHVVVPDAVYQYRRRADGSSIVAQQQRLIQNFDAVFSGPHRELLDIAPSPTPQWLANVILHLSYIVFQRNFSEHSPTYRMPPSELRSLREAFVANLRLIGDAGVRDFCAGFPLPVEVRVAWLAALGAVDASPVLVREVDEVRGVQLLSLFSSSPHPPEGLRIAGEWISNGALERTDRRCGEAAKSESAGASGVDSGILAVKTRRIEFVGSTWGYEHLVRVRGTTPVRLACDPGFSLELDGEALGEDAARIELGHIVPPATVTREPRLGVRARLARVMKMPLGDGARAVSRKLRSARVQHLIWALVWRASGILGFRARAAGAWLFMDGAEQRGNARAVFDVIAVAHPSVNAWFVADSADRVRSRGARVVVAGSWRHFVLAKQSRVVVSSVLDRLESTPFPASTISRTWRRVFVNPDIYTAMEYRRINPVGIDLITTSTVSEYDLLRLSGGDYAVFPDSVLHSGMPRHDLLRVQAERATRSGRPPATLIIAPCLRQRAAAADQWARHWGALLAHPGLRAAAAAAGARVQWVHPGGSMPVLDVPSWIDCDRDSRVLDESLVVAAALVTDYSERSFDAAVCGTPTLFFQFDRTEVIGAPASFADAAFTAAHSGFGLLAREAEEVIDQLPDLLAYTGREIEAQFFASDRMASERVITAIEGMLRE
ncbi:glycosyltransferase [Leucobacter sp. NPDC077196]|uniref:glycosyltransferase n=1 Tax=Leucobacter sp. NPDC077196 TaxID=3154959 RepID=UPI0034352E52